MTFFCFEDSDHLLVGEFGKGTEALASSVSISVGAGERGEGGSGPELLSAGIRFLKGTTPSGSSRLTPFVTTDCIYVH